jgi:hypothetical protein
MKIGGWKTPSMFRRYNISDQTDVKGAFDKLSGFLVAARTRAAASS